MWYVAEEEGFEPPIRLSRIAVFKTAAFDHSATPPRRAGGEHCSVLRAKGRLAGRSA
jgi:hypothetical protein